MVCDEIGRKATSPAPPVRCACPSSPGDRYSIKEKPAALARGGPGLEYFRFVENGTYSMSKCEIALNTDRRWAVQKMRGKDETRTVEKIRRKKRSDVFHWEEGKLVTKDLVLTRIEPK